MMKMIWALPAMAMMACVGATESPLDACESYMASVNSCVDEMFANDTGSFQSPVSDAFCMAYENLADGKAEAAAVEQLQCAQDFIDALDCSDAENLSELGLAVTSCI